MTNVTTAIIILKPPKVGYKLLFNYKIASVPLFKRLVLTLDRAGIENICIFSRELPSENCKKIEEDISNDSRFRKNLYWFKDQTLSLENALKQVQKVSEGNPYLVTSGNVVASFRLISSFVRKAEGFLNDQQIVSLSSAQSTPGGVYLLAPESLDLAERLVADQSIEKPTKTIEIQEKTNYWTLVTDHPSIMHAEKQLIQNQKYHHNQLMDRVANTIFSIPITRLLLNTPTTPNQITLLGVFIGCISFYLLSTGCYLEGLLGGFAATATAIIDCCDGEIARLKFLDTETGDYLDQVCDNVINVLVFSGIAIGMARQFGVLSTLPPTILIIFGGGSIFFLVYFEKGKEKGALFKGTKAYQAIQQLATRDYLYMVLLFSIIGKTHWFLWISAIGSVIFASFLYHAKSKFNLGERTKETL